MAGLKLILRGSDEENVARYERLRKQFHLPQIWVERLAEETRVEFGQLPPSLVVGDDTKTFQALSWIAQLEQSCGQSLGQALWPDEPYWDADRGVAVIARGLLQPNGDGEAIGRFALVFGLGGVSFRSFEELVTTLAGRRPELRRLMQLESAEELLRRLRSFTAERLEEGQNADALRYAEWAFDLRPTDIAVAEDWIWVALAADSLQEVPDSVWQIVERYARRRHRSALLLTRARRRLGQSREALESAKYATELGPRDVQSWKQLAHAAHEFGDRAAAIHAMVAAARLGDEASLCLVASLVPSHVWFEVLDSWCGEFSPGVVRLRVQQLHSEERLSELLQFYQDNWDAIDALDDAEVVEQVFEAACRIPGTLLRLRLGLLKRTEGQIGDQMMALLVRVCSEEGVSAPIVQLGERFPDRISPAVYVQALLDEGRHEQLLQVIGDDWQESGELACFCIHSMIQLEVGGLRSFDRHDWRVRLAAVPQSLHHRLRPKVEWLTAHRPDFTALSVLSAGLGLS